MTVAGQLGRSSHIEQQVDEPSHLLGRLQNDVVQAHGVKVVPKVELVLRRPFAEINRDALPMQLEAGAQRNVALSDSRARRT